MIKGDPTRTLILPALNGGLNTRDPDYSLKDNQSPDLLNVWWKNKALSKRNGQELVTPLADCHRISDVYNSFQCIHAGTSLYKWDKETATEIKTGIQPTAGVFIEFGDDLYYVDGVEIWHINSSYVVTAVAPHVPTVALNCNPDMSSSDSLDSYNMIGRGFEVTYNGDGSSATYTLPQKDLAPDTVIITVGTTTLTEGTHFTVNRTSGTVSFSGGSSPHGAPTSGTNNVSIKAYVKTCEKAKIAACTIGVPFGGESSGLNGGSRVVMMGNSQYPLYYWRSDLGQNQRYGMTYFPDDNYELLDQNAEKITAAAKMQGQLIVFKENSIFAIGYVFDGETVYYPVRECNSSIGCDIPGSIQLINNQLVFAHTKSGIHMLKSSENQLENQVYPLSANINSLLMDELETSAVSVDHDQYYWLRTGNFTFVWDYGTTAFSSYQDYDKGQRRLAWYKFNNISANDFYADTDLYYCSGEGIVKFISPKNDYGNPINAYIKTKAYDFGSHGWEKFVDYVVISFISTRSVKADVIVSNEDDSSYANETYEILTFNWADFNWARFTWNVIKHAATQTLRARMKNTQFMQITVESNYLDRDIGLSNIEVYYRPIKRIR